MPRQPIPARAVLRWWPSSSRRVSSRSQQAADPNAAALQNPVAATPESIAAGKKAYDANCAACHGTEAQGAVKAGVIISIIQEQGGKQPPDLTDAAVGPRLDRRRDLHRHQEGRAADDDGRVGGPHLGHRDLEHRRLPARARGERRPSRPAPAAPAAAARRATAGAGARRLRADADHRRPRRREHARPAGARQLPARRAGRPPLLRQRPQRPALHPRQADQGVHDLSRFQRRRRAARACSRSSRSSATSPPASSTSSSIPTTRATASSTRSTWRTRPSTRRPTPQGRRRAPASTCPATRRRRRSRRRRAERRGSTAKPC